MRGTQAWLGVLAAGALAAACGPATVPPPPEEPAAAAEAPESFGRDRAAAHWATLEHCGAREAGSRSAACAREAIADALRGMGVEPSEQRVRAVGEGDAAVETVNLVGAIPGPSADVVLLVAPYDAAPGGARGGEGSGAALVLELGRALAVRGFPYTVELAFVEGDALAGGATPPGATAPAPLGSAALAQELDAKGALARVLVAVYFDRLAVPDLRVARDLLSSRSYREEFWTAARRLGRTDAFPPEAPFETVAAGQTAFLARGMRRAVALVASSDGAPAAPAPDGSAAPAARSAEESLALAGEVSLEALAALGARLEKIDRFAAPRAGATPEEPR